MHPTRRTTCTTLVLVTAVALVALLGASNAAARGPQGAHSAVRGPGGVAQSQTPQWQQSDFGWADGLVVSGALVALGIGLGYAFVSTRGAAASGSRRPAASVRRAAAPQKAPVRVSRG